jgi:hypothetical protein
VLWLAPHAAHTSLYVPFIAGMPGAFIPPSHTINTLDRVDRGVAAWQASRFVFNVAQARFFDMVQDIQALQSVLEARSEALVAQLVAQFAGAGDIAAASRALAANAMNMSAAWWQLSDDLLMRYADGTCHSCGRAVEYQEGWLNMSGFRSGPPPSPPVPPLVHRLPALASPS